jgi:uncharacterized protein YndB with AHSA1/START domain
VKLDREVVIARPIEEVFEFVADARNDVRWCPKVRSVSLVSGEDAEARYAVVHKPVPWLPSREMQMNCVWFDRPQRLEWREEDGTDVFRVTYELESLDGGKTRFRQRSDAELGAPSWMHPIYKAGIGRDLARQLRKLKKLLEKGN